MVIQGTQVPMYTEHCFYIFFLFFFFYFIFLFWKKNKIKTKQPNKNRQTIWKHERKMQMHESMIPKTDKKSSKWSPTLDRKN